jgi:hypothetical protein
MTHLNAGQTLVGREHGCRQPGQPGPDNANIILFFCLRNSHQFGRYDMYLIIWQSDTNLLTLNSETA